jgi:hypothetical protein
MGHEDAFPQPTLSARSRISQRTFARTRVNGRDARVSGQFHDLDRTCRFDFIGGHSSSEHNRQLP